MRRAVVCTLLLAIVAFPGRPIFAECPPPQPQPTPADALDRLANLGLSIRKSFAGKKDENQPAAISYVSANDGGSAYNVDFAIKHRGIDCTFGDPNDDNAVRRELLVFPSAELHRSSVSTAEVNKLSGALNAEYYLTKASWKSMPFTLVKSSLTRDAQKHQMTSGATIAFSAMATEGNGGPGRPIRDANDNFIARYYPYVGAEYVHNLPITTGFVRAPAVDASFATLRLFVEWYPANRTRNEGRLQVLADATLRHRFGGDSAVARSPWLVVADAIYYFDTKLRFGLGYEYEHGRNPQNNFQRLTLSSLNLKMKV